MKNKKLASCAVGISGIFIVACLTLTPMIRSNHVGAQKADQMKIEAAIESKEQEEKEKEFMSEDYQDYVQSRIDTMEIAISDMQREVDRGDLPKENHEEFIIRIDKLSKILDIYNSASKGNKSKDISRSIEITDKLFEDLENFYDEMDAYNGLVVK